jgi:hypothetical protein
MVLLGALFLGDPSPPLDPASAFAAPLAALGIAAGLVHFVMQGKGWEYHLYPLALFLCALAAPAFATRREARGRRPPSVLFATIRAGPRGQGRGGGGRAVDRRQGRRVGRRRASTSRRACAPGATVQVMDVPRAGLHALLRPGRSRAHALHLRLSLLP